MSDFLVSSVGNLAPTYNLTTTDYKSLAVGDHVLAPTLTGDGVYRVTAVSGGTSVTLEDDLDPGGGTYGAPVAGTFYFATPNSDTTTPVPFGAKWWNAARNRNPQIQGTARMKADGRFSYDSTRPMAISNGGTLYYHRFVGQLLSIYNGTRFVDQTIPATPITLSLGALADGIYDVHASMSGGTMVLTSEAWGGATRSTALDVVEGVFVSGSDNTKRYLGSITVTSNAGSDDGTSINHYNRCYRSTSGTYSGTWTHAANGQQVSFATVAQYATWAILQHDQRGNISYPGLERPFRATWVLRVQTAAGATEQLGVLRNGGTAAAGLAVTVQASADTVVTVFGELNGESEGATDLTLYETHAGTGTNTLGETNVSGYLYEWWS